jgi:hypothetical protein
MHQSSLSFKPTSKPSIAPQVTPEPDSDCIDLVSDSSGDENVASHPISEHEDESGEDDGAEFELVEAWIVRQEVPVAGGMGTVAVELELDAYAGGMDNDTGEKDVGEENEGDAEGEDEEEEEEETELTDEAHMMREGPYQAQSLGTCQNLFRALILTSCMETEREDDATLERLSRNSSATIAAATALAAIEDDTPDSADNILQPLSIPEALERISELLSGGKKKVPIHPAAAAPLAILRNFFIRRSKGDGILLASQSVAGMWREGKGVALARRIRYLSRFYLKFHRLPAETRGGIRAGSSLLRVEAIHSAVSAWLESQTIGSITPRRFRQAVIDILPTLGYLNDASICERTARRWLMKLGYTPKPTRKGVYEDGHEREDVVEYRNDVFLPLMAEMDRRSVGYEPKEDGGWTEVPPELREGERRVVLYYHDESCFHEKDFRKTNWLHSTQQILPGKGQGRIIHVSDFVTNATPSGRLVHTDPATGEVVDARVIIKPGSQGDPWWDTKQLMEQVKHALTVHEMVFGSDVEAVFVFDQSSAHNSAGEGALDAFGMNKGSTTNRKNPVWYKDTIVPDDVPNVALRGKTQRLMQEDNPTQPKGTAKILAERGIFPKPKTLAKCSPRCYETAVNCCYARILHNQKDFKEQKSALETLVNLRGHSTVFLPKFHGECDPIEMY